MERDIFTAEMRGLQIALSVVVIRKRGRKRCAAKRSNKHVWIFVNEA
jgi:hypothetical protein